MQLGDKAVIKKAIEQLSQLDLNVPASATASTQPSSAAAGPSAAGASVAGSVTGGTTRKKRWGEGLDAPAAGARSYFPNGYVVEYDVPQAIKQFGHSDAQVAEIMDNGRRLSNDSLAATHAAALYAYTLEQPGLYKTLNFNMFTPGDQADTNLKRFRDYIKHTTTAANALPNFVGMTYRGTERIFKQSLYKPGDRITWQVAFVTHPPPHFAEGLPCRRRRATA